MFFVILRMLTIPLVVAVVGYFAWKWIHKEFIKESLHERVEDAETQAEVLIEEAEGIEIKPGKIQRARRRVREFVNMARRK